MMDGRALSLSNAGPGKAMTSEVPEPNKQDGDRQPKSPPAGSWLRSSRERPKVALIEGPRPRLLAETRALLRVRLRGASLMLFLGAGLFVAWSVVTGNWVAGGDPFFVAWHLGIFAVGIAGAAIFSSPIGVTLGQLRLAEALIFGMPAFFVLALDFRAVPEAGGSSQIDLALTPWMLIIFAYALFIPNTPRRAAAVICALGVAPEASALIRIFRFPPVDSSQAVDQLTQNVLLMTIAVVAAIYGAHLINALRHEAFEARKLGQYHLKRLIGSGGMGEVYLAEHHLLKRPCAIKVIRPGKETDPKVLERFEREVQATAKLSHWNTVEIFDYGRTDDGTFYYVMEFLPGMNLRDLVERYGPLPHERTIHFLWQTCRALREAHRTGLIHQDIKPGNIFAAERGGVYDVAKLLDFGLALPLDDRRIALRGDAIVGSPLFMSPEQILGDSDPDARSDIYSLGAVGYFLLCGRPPFEGNKPIRVMIAHAHDEVVAPSHWRPDVPPDLQGVVMRCLAKQPDDRFPDAESLMEALQACRLADEWTQQRAAAWWLEVESRSPAETTLSSTSE